MHPALSIVVFTTSAGTGYGLLALLALGRAFGLLPGDSSFGLLGLVPAFALVVLGLAASTFHLKHPERAWRALSQWRSSWLSREGVAAAATFVPAGLFAIGWIFLQARGWPMALLGGLTAAGAAVTVYATGMIYASLKTIRQWHQPLVVPVYLSLALASGAVLLTAILALWGVPETATSLGVVAVLATGLAWFLKGLYWKRIDAQAGESSAGSATGLGPLGRVRLLDPPHTEENYLQKEMGYRIARKHARKLRGIALASGGPVTVVLLLLVAVLPSLSIPFSLLAVATMALGLLVERWLFFAEATHKVTLYYGAEAA